MAETDLDEAVSDRDRSLLLFLAVLGAVFVVWLVVGSQAPRVVSDEWAERGLIGDSFGIVNSLFGGLAFAGLVVALTVGVETDRTRRSARSPVVSRADATSRRVSRASS